MTTGILTPQYTRVANAVLCYDLGDWHGSCPDVEVNYPYVYCKNCRCVAHIDLVGHHIEPISSGKARNG